MARTQSQRKPVRSSGNSITAAIEAPPQRRRVPGIVGLVLGLWLVTMIVVTVLVRLPGIVPSGNETTWDRAIFTAVNAATLTGFGQTMGVREMAAAGMGGPVLLFLLTLAGTFVSLFVGGLAAARILRTGHTARQIAIAGLTAQALATVVGAAALLGSASDAFEALFQAASAFGNSGLWLGAYPTTTGPTTHAILLPLAVLGGLGLPVLMELSNWVFGKSELSRHSRVVLKLTAVAYLAGFVLLILGQFSAASAGGWSAWRSTLASCTTMAINTRTAGLPLQSPAAFTAAGQWVLMALMVIGAAPAGTAGGIKLTSLWHVVGGTRDLLGGRMARRVCGIAVVWVGFYGLALFVGMVLLAACESAASNDRLLFLAISALSNVGMSHDPISMTGPGLIVLSGLMLVGRIAPLAVLWWTATSVDDADVLVG